MPNTSMPNTGRPSDTPPTARRELSSPPAGTRSEGPTPWDRPGGYLWLALWYGLALGSVEAVLLAALVRLDRAVLDRFSPYFWSAPFSEATFFLIPGLGLWAWARWRGVRPWFKVAGIGSLSFVFWFALVSGTTLLFLVTLDPLALLVLAMGLAVQTTRLIQRRPALAVRCFRWSAGAMILVALGGILATKAGFMRYERRLMASTPAPRAGMPNVLLVVMDTVRAKSLSLYGYSRETTPALEAWARRGVVFEQAVSTAPFTLTSHASMFTGRYPHELPADWRHPLPAGYPTLAEVLRSNGYRTAGFVANYRSAGRQTGLDRGFAPYIARDTMLVSFLGQGLLNNWILPPSPGLTAREINRLFLQWRFQPSSQPYFAFLNYIDCHVPYSPESTFDEPAMPYPREAARKLYDWCRHSFDAPLPSIDPAILAIARDAYDTSIRRVDRGLDDLLRTLESRGDLTNTIIIITSDHGEQFGEHRLVQHADSLYRSVLHVPLLILHPKGSAGKRERQMVTLRDLPATILDLLNVRSNAIPGESFAGAVLPSAQPAVLPVSPKFAYISEGILFPDWHPNSRGPVSGVFLEGKHYIKSPGKEELYDFAMDPEERKNLVKSAADQDLLRRMRALRPEPKGSAESSERATVPLTPALSIPPRPSAPHANAASGSARGPG